MVLLVKEQRAVVGAKSKIDISLRQFPKSYWKYLSATALFGLGNASNAFLILRTQDIGASLETTILIYAGFNLVAALISYPAGLLSDKWGRRNVLLKTAEDDSIAIKSQIGGGVVKRVTRRRMRLAIINVQKHVRRGVTLRVDRLVRVLHILPILLERGSLASGGRARGELRFFKIEFPHPEKRAALRKGRPRECAGDQTHERDAHQCRASIHDTPP